MTQNDEKILASMGMTAEEADFIADACEAGDCGMWDSSEVSYGSPLEEKSMIVSDISLNQELWQHKGSQT